ncbi:hypothetical protein ACOSQ4_029496 [Xanthoceras sorbifolium]
MPFARLRNFKLHGRKGFGSIDFWCRASCWLKELDRLGQPCYAASVDSTSSIIPPAAPVEAALAIKDPAVTALVVVASASVVVVPVITASTVAVLVIAAPAVAVPAVAAPVIAAPTSCHVSSVDVASLFSTVGLFSPASSTVYGNNLAVQFAVTAWLIWNRRNQFIHGLKSLDSADYWQRAGLFLAEFISANISSPVAGSSVTSPSFWCPPAGGLSSCLADSAAVAEAKAILMGAQFAVKKGLSPVCIASDALKVVNMCNDSSPSRCDLSNIIHDIKVICNVLF